MCVVSIWVFMVCLCRRSVVRKQQNEAMKDHGGAGRQENTPRLDTQQRLLNTKWKPCARFDPPADEHRAKVAILAFKDPCSHCTASPLY